VFPIGPIREIDMIEFTTAARIGFVIKCPRVSRRIDQAQDRAEVFSIPRIVRVWPGPITASESNKR
jgi:hypothetical protein